MPASLYRKLESWHHLSFLRSRENLRILESVRAQALEPEKISRFLEVVSDDLGYHLHRSVQRTKVELSTKSETEFAFADTSLEIRCRVTRRQFEGWIAPDLAGIEDCVQELLARASLTAERIDRVFLTGGSSLVPALRNLFAARFRPEKLASGEEFTSVARGLSLIRTETSSQLR